MKKILNSILLSSLLLNATSNFENNNDSLKLYNIDLEKTILEEMVSSIIHEENIFNMFDEYVLKTGDTNPNNFFTWYNIINNSSNNFVKAYNHQGIVSFTFDPISNIFTVTGTFKKENSFATQKYIEELKNRSIKFSFDSNGYSVITYKLPLKTIKFLLKYKEITNQGIKLANEKNMSTIVSSLANNEALYVPDGNGQFLLYIKSGVSLIYKGLVKTFDGVLINGNKADGTFIDDVTLQLEFNSKLPKIKGSIGYVVLSIKIPETNDEKSAIVEYIYNGTTWVKKFSSVNRESIVASRIIENNSSSLTLSASTDVSIPDSGMNFFESTFVGGLYNSTNVLMEQPTVFEGAALNNFRSNQYKRVTFKAVSKANEYDFSEIFAESYLYTNANMLDIGGSLEHLTLVAKNTQFNKEFKPDTSACDYLGQDWNYDSTTKKCLKVTYTCNSWNDEKITVNGIKYCHDKSDSQAICKGAEDNFFTLNGFNLNTSIHPTACVNKVNTLGSPETETLPVINKNGFNWRIDDITKKCIDHYYKNNYFMSESSKNGNPAGCYWTQDTSKEYDDPKCFGDDIRVDGVCRDLVNGDIRNATCQLTVQEKNKFDDLIANYYFKNPLDKNKYIFGPLSYKVQETSIVDSNNGTTYKVCDYIEYTQEGYKNYYVYPSFDIKIENINKQGKHEVITSPTHQLIYREINISECNWLGENCKSIFEKSKFNSGIQNGKDISYKYGDIFLSSENMMYNGSKDTFEIRKSDYTNEQLLPSTYNTFSLIKNNLSSITNSDNNKTIKIKALKFNITNSSNSAMILDSGPIDVNKVE